MERLIGCTGVGEWDVSDRHAIHGSERLYMPVSPIRTQTPGEWDVSDRHAIRYANR